MSLFGPGPIDKLLFAAIGDPGKFEPPEPPDFFNNAFEFDPANPTFGAFTNFEPTGGIEDAITSLIRRKAERDRISGIVPDRADWEASLAAQIDEIMAGILGSREQFAAATSARGITGSGETPRQLFRDVLAPGVRAATTVAAGATLDFAKFTSQATIAQEQLLQGDRAQLLQAGTVNAQLASVEAQFGANLESTERMAANRNALTKAMFDDTITLETFKTMLNAQLQEYLAQMRHFTATQVAHIQAAWQSEAAAQRNETDTLEAFLDFVKEWFFK